MAFTLPPLPYSPEALEPYIDATTMKVHHGKHHQTYLDKLNAAITGTDLADVAITDILKQVSKYSLVIRNNGGGYYNHNLFWPMLSPQGGGNPKGAIAAAIEETFGGFDQFKEAFTHAAINQFGSGWAWLCKGQDGKLFICATPNQDNPIMDVVQERGIPVLGLDVWEHAYYLNYQNRRAAYVEAFWNVVNWEEVNKRLQTAPTA
eukprot:gene262-345_t